jgi:hypothetical protein
MHWLPKMTSPNLLAVAFEASCFLPFPAYSTRIPNFLATTAAARFQPEGVL